MSQGFEGEQLPEILVLPFSYPRIGSSPRRSVPRFIEAVSAGAIQIHPVVFVPVTSPEIIDSQMNLPG